MRSLDEFILEHIETVNETLSSSIVMKWKAKTSKYYGWRQLMREWQWDKITDDDMVWHDQSEAKKLAYKRNETWTLFWVDENDDLIGYSTSNYAWHVFDQRYYKRMKSIMPMVRDAKGAYSIDDKFSTRELHRIREEAKFNATALMTNERIKNDNLVRYAKIMKDNKVKSGEIYASIKAKLEEATERYKQFFDEVGSADEADFAKKMDELKKVSQAYTDVIFKIKDAADSYERERSGSPWSGIMQNMSRLEETMNRYELLFQ